MNKRLYSQRFVNFALYFILFFDVNGRPFRFHLLFLNFPVIITPSKVHYTYQ